MTGKDQHGGRYFQWAMAGFAALTVLAACKDKPPEPQPDNLQTRLAAGAARVDAAYLATGGDGRDWPATGFSYAGQHFSPLDKIDARNVARLGIAWYTDLPDHLAQDTTPVVVDGVIYIAAARSKVAAFNAADGKLLWDYDPRLATDFPVSDEPQIANNGIALWKGKLFTTTLDGRLTALDAKTGIPLWSIQAAESGQRISGTPVIVKNLVIIGTGGGGRGSIAAYDIVNGTLRWRFFTSPNPSGERDNAASDPMLAVATATWSKDGDWRTSGGGGAVTGSIVYDAELDQLYFGTGPGVPRDYTARSGGNGDNLFLSSIVAVKPETGEYLWHFQETPAARHDFGAGDPMILASLAVEGTTRKLLLHPSANGFLVALAREDGALVAAVPLAKDVAWAKGYDAGGRPVPSDPAKPAPKTKAEHATIAPIVTQPTLGWRDGAAASFAPSSALIYVPVQRPRPALSTAPTAIGNQDGTSAAPLYGKGGLVAMSPLTGRIAWSSDRAMGGGVLTTAGGLVFQGARDGGFVAYGAADGNVLWQSRLRGQITGAPVTFLSGKTQMVAILTGAPPILSDANHAADAPPVLGRRSRLVVFALGGQRQLPPLPEPVPNPKAAIIPGEAKPRAEND